MLRTSTSNNFFATVGRQWSKVEARYQIMLACFLATMTAYIERVGFSIAFTGLAKEASLSESLKGTVLSAFYWGYAISQIPGGWAAQRWGGQYVLIISFVLWSISSLLTPTNASNSLHIILARVVVGVAQGLIIPSIHTVLSQCIPPHERARAVSLVTSGMYLGSATAMMFLPVISSLFGPASILTVVGFMGLLWLCLWLAIKHHLPNRDETLKFAKTRGSTPWAKMLSHTAVWAIIINNFTFHYAFYVIMNWLPTYFDQVLNSSLSELGSLRTAPYIIMFASSNFGGWLGDGLIRYRNLPIGKARKVVNTLGMWGTSMALLFMPLATGKYSGLFVVSWTLGMSGFSRGGFSVNHMDIAPKFAGPIMGVSNTAGTVAGVIGVAATGMMIENSHQSMLGWWQALLTSSLLCLLSSVFFIVFARGEKIFGDSDND